MKIRIKGNSIRIRLSRPEVDSFGENGYLEERTQFGNSTFIYVLQSKDSAEHLSADFIDGKITLTVPSPITKEWTTTEKVGYEHNLPTGNGEQLYLLIEKDFKCTADVAEDQSDNFENPLAACK